jgi:hypothetical protein
VVKGQARTIIFRGGGPERSPGSNRLGPGEESLKEMAEDKYEWLGTSYEIAIKSNVWYK